MPSLRLGSLALLVAAVGSGCSRAEFFSAPISLSDGVRGRSWQSAQELELDADAPLVDSLSRSFYGFDFAVAPMGESGVLVFSAATSSGNTNRVPMARLYTGDGFVDAGPSFGALSPTPSSYTFVSVVPSLQDGDYVASFVQVGSNHVSFQGVRLGTNAGGWGAGRTQALAAPAIASASDFRSGPPMLGVFDLLGRGFFQLVSTGATWNWVPYDLGNPSGFGSAVSTPTGTDARVARDSAGRILSINTTASGLELALANEVTGSLTGVTPVALSLTAASGAAAATDDTGGALVLANVGGALRYWEIQDGTLSGLNGVLDSSVGTWGTGTRAAVVDLGRAAGTSLGSDGKYLAVWVALVSGTSQVWSGVFDRASGSWSSVTPVTSSESYTTAPRHVAVRLSAYRNGNAALAISHLKVPGASALTHEWETQVARYNIDSGWLGLETVSEGCTGDLVCSHLPAVGVLKSGNSVVIYPDQDSNSQYRLRGIEFRK